MDWNKVQEARERLEWRQQYDSSGNPALHSPGDHKDIRTVLVALDEAQGMVAKMRQLGPSYFTQAAIALDEAQAALKELGESLAWALSRAEMIGWQSDEQLQQRLRLGDPWDQGVLPHVLRGRAALNLPAVKAAMEA